MSETIAQQHDLNKLFHELAERLHSVLAFDFLALVLHEPSRNTMRLHILETREAPVKEPRTNFPWRIILRDGSGKISGRF